MVYICHGRKSNLVEFQILPVESPIGVSTSRNSRTIYQVVGLSTKINFVESPIGVFIGRKSNLEDLGIAWSPKSNNLDRYSILEI